MIKEPPVLTIARDRPRPSAAQIAAFQGVASSFVVDAMEGRGALSGRIATLSPDQAAVAGPALTADNPAGDILGTMAALDQVQPGDVVVAAVQGHQGCAAAGDRVAGMMKNCGAVGFVTDGPMRDITGILATGLGCWCTGLTPASPFTMGPARVGLPVVLGDQQVASGDMVVADRDGVVIVPFTQIDTVIAALAEVAEAEAALDAQVADGLRIPPAVAELIASDRTRFV